MKLEKTVIKKYTSESKDQTKKDREVFLRNYPKWEDFRKYCYNMSQAEKYNLCTDSADGCIEGARSEGRELEKSRAKK